MMRLILISAVVLCSCLSLQAQEDPLAGKVYFGFGVGIDHGGLGVRTDIRPWKHAGIFGGVGWALAGIGWNAGIHCPILADSKVSPYVTGMYGYNAAYVIRNTVSRTNWDQGIYYGFSFGGGIEIPFQDGDRLFRFGVLRPIRSDGIEPDRPWITESFWPIVFSIGLHFRY